MYKTIKMNLFLKNYKFKIENKKKSIRKNSRTKTIQRKKVELVVVKL